MDPNPGGPKTCGSGGSGTLEKITHFSMRRSSDGFGGAGEMEDISRGSTLEDFVTILTEGSMQDNTVARIQSTRVQTPLSPLYYM
jgi:hypothetical protein